MDRFEAMTTLLAVVDAGSLSGASRRLGAPLPTVSRRVSELEKRLGAQLLIRTSRRVELTEAGREFTDAVRRILDQVEDAEQAAAGEYLEPIGELGVTAPPLFGELHVAPLANGFLAEHPKIDLRLVFTDAALNLADARLHVAVRIGELQDSSLFARRVGSTRLLTCASPEYVRRAGEPQRPEDLPEHQGVAFRGASAFPWRYLTNGQIVACEPRARLAADSAAAAVRAAEAGLGVTRAFDYQVAAALHRGALVPLLQAHEPPALPISLVHASQGRAPLKVRAFLDWIGPRLKARLAAEGVGDPTAAQRLRAAG